MRLPGRERAVVDIAKLRDYCLNPFHPRGRYKARVFAASLRLTQADAKFLRRESLRAARAGDARKRHAYEYGERFTIDFEIALHGRRAAVRSTWIVRRADQSPGLTTRYIL